MNSSDQCFLPDQTRLTQVHLRTRQAGPLLDFYSGVLGLPCVASANGRYALGDSRGTAPWLMLTEAPGAAPRPARSTGLYHFAIRYPTRQELALAYQQLRASNHPIAGASDHRVSEAIYLNDPDGNGVELYADRPRSSWPWRKGQVQMDTEPLDLESLLAALPAAPHRAACLPHAELGHIHLHVSSLAVAEQFYGDFLGLAVTQRSYPGALFFAAGGYHHHVGANTWAGGVAPPAGSVGLVSYRLEVPVAEILYCLSHRAPLVGYETRTTGQETDRPILQIRDPNGNWLEVQASPVRSAAAREVPAK